MRQVDKMRFSSVLIFYFADRLRRVLDANHPLTVAAIRLSPFRVPETCGIIMIKCNFVSEGTVQMLIEMTTNGGNE